MAKQEKSAYIAGMSTQNAPQNANNTLHFMKWHGAGNDFVVIDSRAGARREASRETSGQATRMHAALARYIGDRHKGVGFDQLAEIHDSPDADIALDFWNADGSRAGACGNATRCVAHYIMADLGMDALTIRTTRGLLHARKTGDVVSVNMGKPQLAWQDIPLARNVARDVTRDNGDEANAGNGNEHGDKHGGKHGGSHNPGPQHLPLAGDPAAIGMGNPHCVYFVPDIAAIDLAGRGAAMENHALFPEATNVEFVQVINPGEIRMRVWERGTGITLACGSGACAAVVAAASRGLTERRVQVQVDGGWLAVDWQSDGVWLSGPVAHVFDAVLTTVPPVSPASSMPPAPPAPPLPPVAPK